LSEKGGSFLRLLKHKGFREENMTKVGLYAIGTYTTLESNKSHSDKLSDPFYQPLLSCATAAGRQKPKHLSWRRQRQRATPRTHAVMQKRATAPPGA
jgi:hypothetical protein